MPHAHKFQQNFFAHRNSSNQMVKTLKPALQALAPKLAIHGYRKSIWSRTSVMRLKMFNTKSNSYLLIQWTILNIMQQNVMLQDLRVHCTILHESRQTIWVVEIHKLRQRALVLGWYHQKTWHLTKVIVLNQLSTEGIAKNRSDKINQKWEYMLAQQGKIVNDFDCYKSRSIVLITWKQHWHAIGWSIASCSENARVRM